MKELIIKLTEPTYRRVVNNEGDMPTMVREAIRRGKALPKCKDCKFFEYDSFAQVDGIPIIVAHEICSRWGDGCKTSEGGYCFLFEAKTEQEEEHG